MSSFFNFNDAPEQAGGELIPAKTLAKVVMVIRPGGGGEDGWLKIADSEFQYLDTEFTISSDPFMRRKIWQNMGVGGPTDGHQKAAQITRATLRAILESAFEIDPKDESDRARKARQVSGWGDFNELEFAVEIGIEKDKTGQYPDKNKIAKIITPNHKDYKRVMGGETIVPAGVSGKAAPKVEDTPPWEKKEEPAPAKNNNPIPAWAR